MTTINLSGNPRWQALTELWAARGSEAWWERADAGRTHGMSSLRLYTGREDLSIDEVRSDPVNYLQLLNEWQLCGICTNKPQPTSCPQAAKGITNHYLVLRTWFQREEGRPPLRRQEFRIHRCPGHKARGKELAELYQSGQLSKPYQPVEEVIPGDYAPELYRDIGGGIRAMEVER